MLTAKILARCCLLLGLLAALGGCVEPVVTPTVTPAPPASSIPPTPGSATAAPAPLESLRIPEVASTRVETIYTQARRASLGGADMLLWPDGTIGFVPVDGQFRFFAANGPNTARTLGSFDDPGALVEDNRMFIPGISDVYPYAAGGPVYRDAETGMLILFYHIERHFNETGSNFQSALGLAASHDEGQTFQDLGLIVENNAPPDPDSPCCADMGGATVTIKDGTFYLYFRDRQEGGFDVQLALATAPVDEVVQAARDGRASAWVKYYPGEVSPGLGGPAMPLELGNPQTNWFGVSYNTLLGRFIMAIARSGGPDDPSELTLIASEDGIQWSPRVTLTVCACELTYPTIIDPGGDPFNTGGVFYIYYVTTAPGATRWHDSTLERMTVTLSGEMVEAPHAWEFEETPEGWTALHHIALFEVRDGTLVIEPSGDDPYMVSPSLGLSSELYRSIEVRMRTEAPGIAQFFFSTGDAPGTSEENSVRFPVSATGAFETYRVDLSGVGGWAGHIATLRFDPIDQQARVEIDSIRVLP